MADETLNGRVKWFNDQRGFGFIERDDHFNDLFCHISEVALFCDYPKRGDKVSFIEDKDHYGRLVARQVVVVE